MRPRAADVMAFGGAAGAVGVAAVVAAALCPGSCAGCGSCVASIAPIASAAATLGVAIAVPRVLGRGRASVSAREGGSEPG